MEPIVLNSKEYYSKKSVADEYDIERFSSKGGEMFDAFEKEIVVSNLPLNSSHKKVLDMGAGSGRFTIEMARKGFNVTSCDYSSEMLRIIDSKIIALGLQGSVILSKQDITKISLEDNIFDFVCCMRVTVNLDTRENVCKGLRELFRVCKPGGTIVFDIVNPRSAAIFGPLKSSMLTMDDAKRIILSIPGAKIEKSVGRRILSQTAFEKIPESLLGMLDQIDSGLSRILPQLCVRVYFVVRRMH